MSQLQTLEIEKLRTVDGFPRPEPGEYVTHVDDRKALGTLVAIVGEECSVLWSRKPTPTIPDVSVSMQTQHINACSRKLRATWGVQLPRETTYEVKEEATLSSFSYGPNSRASRCTSTVGSRPSA